MATNDDFIACACCGKNSEKECKFCGTPFCCDACYDKSKESHEAVCSELYNEGLVATYLDASMLKIGKIEQLLPSKFGKYSGIVQQFSNNDIYIFGVQSSFLRTGGVKTPGLMKKMQWLRTRTFGSNFDRVILTGVEFTKDIDTSKGFAQPLETAPGVKNKGKVRSIIVIGTSASHRGGEKREYDINYGTGLLAIQNKFSDIVEKYEGADPTKYKYKKFLFVGQKIEEIPYPDGFPKVVQLHKCPTT